MFISMKVFIHTEPFTGPILKGETEDFTFRKKKKKTKHKGNLLPKEPIRIQSNWIIN